MLQLGPEPVPQPSLLLPMTRRRQRLLWEPRTRQPVHQAVPAVEQEAMLQLGPEPVRHPSLLLPMTRRRQRLLWELRTRTRQWLHVVAP